MMSKLWSFQLILGCLVVLSYAITLKPAKVSLLSPRGIRFEIEDPGVSFVSLHYSVNAPLPNLQTGHWNFDLQTQTGGKWIHENTNVNVLAGDTVYYWIHAMSQADNFGYTLLNQRWLAVSPSSQPQETGSNSEDDVWKGRKLRLVFEDSFDGPSVNASKWNYDVSMWGGGNGEFQTYTPLEQNTYTRNGALFIKPTLTSDKYGESFLTTGVWDIKNEFGYCTNEDNWGCKREGKYGMLPPIMSGRIKSKGQIRYGKVEIIAKLPRGDWIWPAFWMLPKAWSYGGWPKSGEIDIMESRGNRHYGNLGVEYMASTLHWGSNWDQNRFQMTSRSKKVSSGTLADGYHKYTLYWDQDGLEFFLDDEHIVKYNTPNQGYWKWGNLPGNSLWQTKDAPFDKEFYLLINVAVGGTNGYMPDGVSNEGYAKPWKNNEGKAFDKFWSAKDKWYPTWRGDDAALQVDSVKMWQLE